MSLTVHEKLKIEQELKDLWYSEVKDKELYKFVVNSLEKQNQVILDLKDTLSWMEQERTER